MRKIFMVCMMICIFGLMLTTAQEYNFEEYVYPFGFRTYSSPDDNGNLSSVTQYSFESQAYDNYLVEEVYIGYGMMSAKTTYRYHTDENAVISDVQLRQNRLTESTKYQDRIILFAFPEKDKPFKWTETNRGDEYQCSSEYVYINASIYRKSLFMKAVKITRDNSYVVGNQKHKITETSYWVSDYGRIITYVEWDGTKKVSSKLDVLDYIQEISEDVYKLKK